MKREDIFRHFKECRHDCTVKADPSYLRVMTSNVLCSNYENSKNFELTYEERADILAAQYLYFQPDFLGLQEVNADMKVALTERFSDVYAFVETPTGERMKQDGHWYPFHNYAPVVYNKHLYEVLDSRFHVFDHSTPLNYHWALYRSKNDPAQRFLHVNLHLHAQMGQAQMPQAVEVHTELVHLRRHYPTVPIFVTGDYNCYHTQKPFQTMIEGLEMKSAMTVAEDIEPNGQDYWCHLVGSTQLQTGHPSAIDHITVTTDLLSVKVHRVLFDDLLCKSSDHCARFADLAIKPKGEFSQI